VRTTAEREHVLLLTLPPCRPCPLSPPPLPATLQPHPNPLCRWEVYVCTTAEREYAWEAWRLLDPSACLFPTHQLSWRMLCVTHPQKKDLLNVLRQQEVAAAVAAGLVAQCASDPQMVTDAGVCERGGEGGDEGCYVEW
jgi:hypothetical protein